MLLRATEAICLLAAAPGSWQQRLLLAWTFFPAFLTISPFPPFSCSALMNVAIKSGQLQKALEVYHEMLREGCTPNVVTYNTLIDVYGKTGQWQEALRVIETMNASNTKPVTRTYNTLMIACNTSGQWQEALSVYNDMVRRGHQPNTTTYNALISAYSKAGRLEKVRKHSSCFGRRLPPHTCPCTSEALLPNQRTRAHKRLHCCCNLPAAFVPPSPGDGGIPRHAAHRL